MSIENVIPLNAVSGRQPQAGPQRIAAKPTWLRRFSFNKKKRTHEHTDFLPAALEILETAPSPIGRAISWLIVLFFAMGIAWACLGDTDIVATAPGKVVATGRSKVIQPLETGVVKAVHVRDGDVVHAGQVLVELDLTMTGAERDRMASDLLATEFEVARYRAAISDDKDVLPQFVAPQKATAVQVALQKQLLFSLLSENTSKLAGLENQKSQKEADLAAVTSTIRKLEETLPIMSERVAARRTLAEQGYGSRLIYLENQQALVEKEYELQVQRNRLVESRSNLNAIKDEIQRTRQEFRRNNLDQLTRAEQRMASLQNDLIKAEEKHLQQTLLAPVDGVVQQLQAHTIGGVVTAAQAIMIIAPSDGTYEVEAMISNRDIGFVFPGQEVEVKVDTFNFTKYGLLTGKVLSVSRDTSTVSPSSQSSNNSTDAATSRGEGGYTAQILLDKGTIQAEGRELAVSSGMAVTAEIKTGQRRLIEFVLSPVLRYRQESMRER